MLIQLQNIGQRFNREWVFKGLSFEFNPNESYAVLGHNGSGKSTLLKLIAGNIIPSEGNITYYNDNKKIEAEDLYKFFSFYSQDLLLPDEFTLKEIVNFHFKFKPFINQLNTEKLVKLLDFGKKDIDNRFKYYSSGMKQRVKLALAICSDTPALILDEPTSNLDIQGQQWYMNLIQDFTQNRLVIIGSNKPSEYSFCKNRLDISEYRKGMN